MQDYRKLWMTAGVLLAFSLACGLPSRSPPPTGREASAPTLAVASPQPLPPPSGNLVSPSDFEYLGAFRLPGGHERPQTSAYGGKRQPTLPRPTRRACNTRPARAV